MALDYLDFEYSEDDDGNGTWDAMASVAGHRWPDLLNEVREVLRWATRDFRGRRAALDDGGDWDFDLSAQDDDSGHALPIRWDGIACVLDAAAPQPGGYGTLTLTLSGTSAFGDALREQWEVE